MRATIGYIVTNLDSRMPLQYYNGIVAVGDCATMFTTKEAAEAAIESTIQWARQREQELDIAPCKLTYAQACSPAKKR